MVFIIKYFSPMLKHKKRYRLWISKINEFFLIITGLYDSKWCFSLNRVPPCSSTSAHLSHYLYRRASLCITKQWDLFLLSPPLFPWCCCCPDTKVVSRHRCSQESCCRICAHKYNKIWKILEKINQGVFLCDKCYFWSPQVEGRTR